MELPFSRTYWEENLCYPDWYVRLEAELRQYFFPVVHSDPELKALRQKVYMLVANMLRETRLPLARSGPDLDRERKPIDTIVVHHTEERAEMSVSTLSAIGLLRQYAFQYLANDVLGTSVRGQPIWSGHFYHSSMVFFAYHWLISPDGRAERLLEDTAIGWHAGNWDVNTRSIGIALAGNYEQDTPPEAQITAVARLLRNHYPAISGEQVFGHREVSGNTATTCPGAYFLQAWKETLLNALGYIGF